MRDILPSEVRFPGCLQKKNSMNFSTLHPWPPLLAFLLELDSTQVVSLIDKTGMLVNWTLSGTDKFSNKTRNREYRSRIQDAFQSLDNDMQLRATWILAQELLQKNPILEDVVRAKLAEVGWRVEAGKLVPSSSPVLELLFTQGTEYDSFRSLKGILQSAQSSVVIIDPYLDETIFTMLLATASQNISIKLLTAKAPQDFALEANKFKQQFSQLLIEVRKMPWDFHDRFVIIDDNQCWHIGASIKDAGKRTFMISKIEDSINRESLRTAFEKSWRSGTLIA